MRSLLRFIVGSSPSTADWTEFVTHGMLASALARPKNLFAYSNPKPDVAALAAAYAFGIVKNHPFVDGNKRTAYVICRTFLKLNGTDIAATDVEKYMTFVAVADGSLNEEALAEWIRAHLVKARSQT